MAGLINIKKIVLFATSLILAVCVLFTQFYGIPSFASGSEVWDGSVSASLEGEGTENSPYLINNGSDFACAMQSGGNGKVYKLTADIYLNDLDNINWSTGSVTDKDNLNIWEVASFSGTIDGDGHTIYGIYNDYYTSYANGWNYWADYSGNHAVGFITRVKNGDRVVFKNLGFDNFYLHSPTDVGLIAIVEPTATVEVDKCYIGENGNVIGALVGQFVSLAANYDIPYGMKINNSYSLMTNMVSKSNGGEGLLGGSWYTANGSAHITNCYAVGKVARADLEFTENCYSQTQSGKAGVTLLTAEQMQGEAAKTNMSALDWESAFKTTETYPVLSVFADSTPDSPGQEPGEEIVISVWDGSISASLEGEGTEASPFLINNGSDLAFAMQSGGNSDVYKLTADIYLNDPSGVNWKTGIVSDPDSLNVWDPTTFSGTIDGDGHTIYGIYNDYYTTYANGWNYWTDYSGNHAVGFISRVKNGENVTFKNLGFDNFYLHSPTDVGLIAIVEPTATVNVDRCYIGENSTIIGALVGQFVSLAANYDIPHGMKISNSYSLMTNMVSKSNGGEGLLGGSWYTANGSAYITNCYAVGKVARADLEFTENCYSQIQSGKTGVTLLTEARMQGEEAKVNMPLLDWDNVYLTTEKYPVLYVFTDEKSGDGSDDGPVEEPEEKIWNGHIALKFTEGTGTEDDPFIISKGSQLARAVTMNGLGGSYFKLSADIYLNDTSVSGWENGETLNYWFSDTSGFSGHLDGNGHIVNGIVYKEDNIGNRSGLIPYMIAGSVKNLGVRNSFVYAGISAGGIVGEVGGSELKTIDKCFVDESVSVKFTYETLGGAGGIIGYAGNYANDTKHCLSVSNCYSKAKLDGYEGTYRCNGIIGTSWGCGYTMEDCYSIGYSAYRGDTVGTLSTLVVGLDGVTRTLRSEEVYKDVYTDSDEPMNEEVFTFISDPDSIRASAAETTMSGLDFENIFESVTNGTPKLKIFTQISGEDVNDSEFSGGKGSRLDPYVITTVDQLRAVVESASTKGRYYKLGNDIYINDTTRKNWSSESPAVWYSLDSDNIRFMGNFDGDGHTVYGLYINEKPVDFDEKADPPVFAQGGAGLFPYVGAGAVIKNLHIRDAYISAPAYVGGIVGFIPSYDEGYVTVFGCSADESVTVKGQTAGGLIGGGFRGLVLQYSYSLAKVSSTVPDRTNLLIGDIWNNDYELYECYSAGDKGFRSDYAPINFNKVYGTHPAGETVILKKAQMTGSKARKNMSDLSWGSIWYVADGLTPQLRVISEDMLYSFVDEGAKGRVWSGKTASAFAGGDGSVSNPYLIETPEQLALLVSKGGSQGKYYKLIADIKLNDTKASDWQKTAKEWFSGYCEFSGHFDGNGYVVSGLYINTEGTYAALFPVVRYDASIKRLGVINSYVYNTGAEYNHSYSAAIVGFVSYNEKEKDIRMTMSECFADDTVSVYGFFSGGLICGCPHPVQLENCYFTGSLGYEDRCGGLVGNCWVPGSVLINCYTNTENRDNVCGGDVTSHIGETTYKNVYADYATRYNRGVTKLTMRCMKGKIAEDYMLGFDYDNVWKTVNDGTPVLRAFRNCEQYTCTRDTAKVKIEFVTSGGSSLEPIYGYPDYTKVGELPVPERKGYVFGGWYYYPEYDLPFDFEYFPHYDLHLYAKWIHTGYTEGFEGTLDTAYDHNEAVEHYKPGILGYDPTYIKAGAKCIRTVKDSEVPAMFLLSYENKLEIGKEYEISFWVTGSEGNVSATLQMLHANHPQIDSDIVGYQNVADINIKTADVWQNITFTFVANSEYVVFKVPAGTSLYFDEFEVYQTGKKGKLGAGLEGFAPSAVGTEPDNKGGNTAVLVITVASVMLVMIGVVAIVVILKKRRKTV